MITYEICKKLKELGLKQGHHKGSKYYLTEKYIVSFDTAHEIYDPQKMTELQYWPGVDNIDYANELIYIPSLEDVVGLIRYEEILNKEVNGWLEARKEIEQFQNDKKTKESQN